MFLNKKAKQVFKIVPIFKVSQNETKKVEDTINETHETPKESRYKKKKEVNNDEKNDDDMSYNVNNVNKAEDLINDLTNSTTPNVIRVKKEKGLIEKCDSNNKVILTEDNRQVIFD